MSRIHRLETYAFGKLASPCRHNVDSRPRVKPIIAWHGVGYRLEGWVGIANTRVNKSPCSTLGALYISARHVISNHISLYSLQTYVHVRTKVAGSYERVYRVSRCRKGLSWFTLQLTFSPLYRVRIFSCNTIVFFCVIKIYVFEVWRKGNRKRGRNTECFIVASFIALQLLQFLSSGNLFWEIIEDTIYSPISNKNNWILRNTWRKDNLYLITKY